MTKRRGNLALSGLILAGLGYLLGVLTAPKSGRETRKDIQQSAIKAKREAEKKLKVAHAELSDLVDQGTSKVESLSTKAKAELNKAVESGRAARDKASDLLSAIHEGESDDKELQKAINDANKAVEHLKKYISKNV